MIEYVLIIVIVLLILMLSRKAEHARFRFGNILTAMSKPRYGTLGYAVANTKF